MSGRSCVAKIVELEQQNKLMLDALKRIERSTMSMGYAYAEDFGNDLKRIARDTIAQVKVFTVSERAASSD